jgi:hypothetical protein
VATPPVVSAVDAESVPAPEGIEKLITSPSVAASPLAQVSVAMIVLVLDPSAGRLSGVALTTIELTDPVGVADVPVPVPPSPPVLQPVNITREIHKTRTNKNLNKLLFISLLPCQRMKKNRCIPVLNSLFAHPHAQCPPIRPHLNKATSFWASPQLRKTASVIPSSQSKKNRYFVRFDSDTNLGWGQNNFLNYAPTWGTYFVSVPKFNYIEIPKSIEILLIVSCRTNRKFFTRSPSFAIFSYFLKKLMK